MSYLGGEEVEPSSRMPEVSLAAGRLQRTGELSTPANSQPASQQNPSPEDNTDPDTPPYSLAQLSFMPATQTTVVTTTTTTTLNCAPLLLKEPKSLTNLDPKLYPLASSPTPALIRKFDFEFGGERAAFEEAEHPSKTYRRLARQKQDLLANNGVIRSVKSDGEIRPTKRMRVEDRAGDVWSRLAGTSGSHGLQDQQVTPSASSSNSEARSSSLHGPRRHLPRSQGGISRSSNLQVVQTSTPITPSLADNEEDPMRRDPDGSADLNSPMFRKNGPKDLSINLSDSMDTDESQTELSLKTSRHKPAQSHPVLGSRAVDARRPQPLDTTDSKDVSLPSPSLSPVTAAANLVTKRGYFDHSEMLLNRSPPNETSDPVEAEAPSSQTVDEHTGLPVSQSSRQFRQGAMPSMMDIPTMIESFDALPANVKSYVMFQFLRRCEKPVLQFVADNVNPALKCDFISLLPNELSQYVLGLLDVKSLCRASQVSKKWRGIIDASEKTWKDQMQQAGYHIGPVELRRAITEGWGWQFGSRVPTEDWEKDIGRLPSSDGASSPIMQASAMMIDEEPVVGAALQELQSQSSPLPRRTSKRKPGVKGRATSRKLQKRRDNRLDELPVFDTSALLKQVTTNDGPFAVAQIASMAVPNPANAEVGLEGLRTMHLYKSLYRRQHLIDGYWMSTKLKPKHLAFKAHERHVVTCLHFDSERILTGSDDTNINVYDTKTGVQRNILRGHDGGVWALKCYGNTLVSGSTDRSVRVWDIEAGECTHVFHGHTSTVRCLVILLPTVVGRGSDGRNIVLPREPLIITGSRDSTLRIWKLPQAKDQAVTEGMGGDELEQHYFVRALTGHTHSVRAIAAHGDTLISGSYDHTVRVWRVSTGEQMHTLRGHTQKVYSVVLDMQRNRCISGSMDHTVKIWSLEDGSQIHNLEGHSSLVGLLDLKGDRLVSAAADSTLRIWDPESGHCKATLLAHTGAITCFQHDARKVISGSDRTLKMWDTKTGEFVRDLLTDLSGVWQVGFDGRRCVAAVQRDSLTYIEILDFGAARDGVPDHKRGLRIEVNQDGDEIPTSPGLEDRNEMFMGFSDVQTEML